MKNRENVGGEKFIQKEINKAFSIADSLKSKDIYEFYDKCLIGKQTIA